MQINILQVNTEKKPTFNQQFYNLVNLKSSAPEYLKAST